MAYVQKSKWNKLQEPDEQGGEQKLSGGEVGGAGGLQGVAGAAQPPKQKKAAMPGFVDYGQRVAANKDVIGRGQQAITGAVQGKVDTATKAGDTAMSTYSNWFTPPTGPESFKHPYRNQANPYRSTTDVQVYDPNATVNDTNKEWLTGTRNVFIRPGQYGKEEYRYRNPNYKPPTATQPEDTSAADAAEAERILGMSYDPNVLKYGLGAELLADGTETPWAKQYREAQQAANRANEYVTGLRDTGGIEALGEQVLKAPLSAQDAALMQSGNVLGSQYAALTEEKPLEAGAERDWGVAPERRSKISQLMETLTGKSKEEAKTESEALKAEQDRLRPMSDLYQSDKTASETNANQAEIRKQFENALGDTFGTHVQERGYNPITGKWEVSKPENYSFKKSDQAVATGEDIKNTMDWDAFNKLNPATQGEVMTRVKDKLEKLKKLAEAGMWTSYQQVASDLRSDLYNMGVGK